MNTPDRWVILKLSGPLYKVLASWEGGYLFEDLWRINSGITKCKEEDNYFLFYGHSGSVYRCHKEQYGLGAASRGIYTKLKATYPEEVELLDENTNWVEVSYE